MNTLVVGSINMDVINRVRRFPLPGETVKGTTTGYCAGGKGANQAVAAARAGSKVTFIGAVGCDSYSDELIRLLGSSGIHHPLIIQKNGPSGIAHITIDENGENYIVLSEGANALLSPGEVNGLLKQQQNSFDAVLLQNEIPWETTRYVMEEACKRGIRVFFNPAPAIDLPSEVFPLIDVMILNDTELKIISGISATNDNEYNEALFKIIGLGVKNVVLTLGSKGVLFSNGWKTEHIPAYIVEAVDSTAAGDTFIGALVAAQNKGATDLALESLRFASAAAAIKVTRFRAQEDIPVREEIIRFLNNR
ncbi:ribokinase [Paenibacillus baekrokdamisoli]|uniref:Ribokinase n=1 Tax=Paenibacillus baekrokdamisoli TaxID=1712516 RepID=A0A3G9J6L2_9BACL|nr:ribokinase [Paenibacillus baekrokdamisoli]MBB3067406.1 ribokinase [Paenibacillus baekrokdamisoli]BBH19408.1 ribokinase [Paenibacillus baekrokdamisoli]